MAARIVAPHASCIPLVIPSIQTDQPEELEELWQESASWQDLLARDSGRSMTLRAANNHAPGVRTFYVLSESTPVNHYVVQFIRRSRQRRWFCDCADFKFRRLARK